MIPLRFVPDNDATRAELANLYHLARAAVGNNRHRRMVLAARWYVSEHAGVTATGVYKDLEAVLAWEEISDERSSRAEVRR